MEYKRRGDGVKLNTVSKFKDARTFHKFFAKIVKR